MSVFGSIVSAIFGSKHAASVIAAAGSSASSPSAGSAKGTSAPSPSTATAAGASAPSAGTSTVSAAAAKPISKANVEAILAKLADDQDEDYDWKRSIVDLMKLLKLDSGLGARKQLAQELGHPEVGFFSMLLIGVIAGWIAEKVTESDHSIFTNILVGIAGSFVGGVLASLLNTQVLASFVLWCPQSSVPS